MRFFQSCLPGLIMSLTFCLTLFPMSTSRAEVKIVLTPTITLQQEYTDNFFLEEFKVPMWVTRVATGFKFKANSENMIVVTNYRLGHYWHFTDHSDIDASEQNYFRHDLSAGVAMQPSPSWKFGLIDGLIKSQTPLATLEQLDVPLPDDIPIDDLSDFVEIVSNQILFTRNRAKFFVNHDLSPRWLAKFSYQNEIFTLSSDNADIDALLEGQTEHRGTVSLTFKLDEENHLDLQNKVWHRDFKESVIRRINSDYDAYQTMLIYRRNVKGSPYTFQIGAGYQHRDFLQEIRRQNMDSLNELVFSMKLLRKVPGNVIMLTLDRAINDLTISNNYYASHNIKLAAQRYVFSKRFRLFGDASYEFHDYLTRDPGEIFREDKDWEFNGGVAYRFFDNLELALGYGYTERDSNEAGRGYVANSVFLKLESKYDFDTIWK